MMYTVNYNYFDEKVSIKFTDLNDAFIVARLVKDSGIAGVQNVHVSDTENPDGFYLVPRNPT